MANEGTPDINPDSPNTPESIDESTESFGSRLSQFEKTHGGQSKTEASQKEGIVISISPESVFLDIGLKIEGVISRGEFESNAEKIAVGDRLLVSGKGRNEEGYYSLSRLKLA